MTLSTTEHPFASLPLLLATGQGRSGTTVLTKALAEHPLVYSNRVESNVMKDILLAGHGSSTMQSRIRQMVLPREQHDLVFRQMLLQLLFPVQSWREDSGGNHSEPNESLPMCISTFSAMNPDAANFGASVFPKIHFANIVRDGVEVVASRMVHRALGKHPFKEHCIAWAAGREMAEWGSDRADFTLIRHEHLLAAETCRQAFENLFQQASLAFAPAVPDYIINNRRNQTSYSHESGPQASDLENRRDRWKHWTDEQQELFAEMCGPTMEYFGYAMP